MGLDMSLIRKRYVKNWDHYSPEERTEVTLTVGGKPVPLGDVTYIEEQVGYWRKANAIHKFFVDIAIRQSQGGMFQLMPERGDDCLPIDIGDEDLIELRDRCKAVLADHSKAPELLPTQEGFFFGGIEYDEYYFTDLEDTLKIIEPLIGDETPMSSLYYQASW